MSGHVHDMKQETGKVWKCSSCLFRCTQSSLSTVKAYPHQHRAIKLGDPQASHVWSASGGSR